MGIRRNQRRNLRRNQRRNLRRSQRRQLRRERSQRRNLRRNQRRKEPKPGTSIWTTTKMTMMTMMTTPTMMMRRRSQKKPRQNLRKNLPRSPKRKAAAEPSADDWSYPIDLEISPKDEDSDGSD